MTARVIQGYFVGRGPFRDLGAVAPRAGRPVLRIQAKAPPGRPALAYSPANIGARPLGDGNFEVDPTKLGLARGGGTALPQALLAKMEGAFGADFSQVRVHVGPQAARIGAIAFTTGNDIYFAPGRYQPESMTGQQLLGHELAHVIQQRQGRVRASSAGVSIVQDRALEAEADRLGARAATHRTLQAKGPGGGSHVRVSEPIRDGDGSYRVRAEVAGRNVGSLRMHVDAGRSALVTDLGVDPGHRSQGIGKMLLASAARAGQRFGKSSVTLTADDNGSGKLNRWYGGLGFARNGSDERGRPRFEAQTGRVLAGAAQPKMAPGTPPRVGRGAPTLFPRTLQRSSAYSDVKVNDDSDAVFEKGGVVDPGKVLVYRGFTGNDSFFRADAQRLKADKQKKKSEQVAANTNTTMSVSASATVLIAHEKVPRRIKSLPATLYIRQTSEIQSHGELFTSQAMSIDDVGKALKEIKFYD